MIIATLRAVTAFTALNCLDRNKITQLCADVAILIVHPGYVNDVHENIHSIVRMRKRIARLLWILIEN